MREKFYHGNALGPDAPADGWIIGRFIEAAHGPRKTGDVEVKWQNIPAGTSRPKWGVNDVATSLSILIRGKFRLKFETGEVLLSREGDYVIWPPGEPHRWTAEEESVMLTVRWPSRPEATRNLDQL